MPSSLGNLAPAIAFGGGVTSALLAGAGLSRAGQHAIEEVPEYKRKPGTFREAKKEYGLNVGYAQNEDIDNAMSIPKQELQELSANYAAHEPTDTSTKLKQFLRKAKEHGLIVTGEGYRRPGVVEHELGHAIAQNMGTPWERFTHSRIAPLLSLLGTAGGMGAGLYAGKKWGPAAGALAGLGASALGNVPTIHGEMVANQYANELLPENAKSVKTWPFVGSYINAGVTAPTVAGALMGLLGRH